MIKLVIFDADGTLTPMRQGSAGPFSWTLLPGVRERCKRLHFENVTLAIASNQSSKRSRRDIIAQLRWTATEIGAAMIRWATTDRRRKPRPAMLKELMTAFGVSPDETFFIGDREDDRLAAETAGVRFQWADEWRTERRPYDYRKLLSSFD